MQSKRLVGLLGFGRRLWKDGAGSLGFGRMELWSHTLDARRGRRISGESPVGFESAAKLGGYMSGQAASAETLKAEAFDAAQRREVDQAEEIVISEIQS